MSQVLSERPKKDNNEIDFFNVIQYIWTKRMVLMIWMIIFIIIGFTYGCVKFWLYPKQYRSKTIITLNAIPFSTENQYMIMSSVSIGTQPKIDFLEWFEPNLLPIVIQSDAFVRKVGQMTIDEPITGKNVLLSSYLNDHDVPPNDVINDIRSRINITPGTGPVTVITCDFSNPDVARQVLDSVIVYLDVFFRSKFNEIKRMQISNLEKLAEKEKSRFKAVFESQTGKMKNFGWDLEKSLSSNELEIIKNQHTNIMLQIEWLNILTQNQNSIVCVIDPPAKGIDIKPVNFVKIIFAMVFAGLFVGLVWIYLQRGLNTYKGKQWVQE